MNKGADSTRKVIHVKERLVICNKEDTDYTMFHAILFVLAQRACCYTIQRH